MLGAIIGDVIGSRFEFRPHKSKEFELFHASCHFTDDSAMTIAVASAILDCGKDTVRLGMVTEFALRRFGKLYPNAGYGGTFAQWIYKPEIGAYNSWGNGSAMRVSPCGWAGDSLQEVLTLAEHTAEVTHNHPEGIKGAKAIAACIYLARTGSTKEEIRDYIRQGYYGLNFTLDEIRPDYRFDVSCMGSVPQAIEAFLEGESFEDVIRCAVSIGGDSDTIAAMAGSIAQAYYGIPQAIRDNVMPYLDDDQREILHRFEAKYGTK